jgi:hypothetical protein
MKKVPSCRIRTRCCYAVVTLHDTFFAFSCAKRAFWAASSKVKSRACLPSENACSRKLRKTALWFRVPPPAPRVNGGAVRAEAAWAYSFKACFARARRWVRDGSPGCRDKRCSRWKMAARHWPANSHWSASKRCQAATSKGEAVKFEGYLARRSSQRACRDWAGEAGLLHDTFSGLFSNVSL